MARAFVIADRRRFAFSVLAAVLAALASLSCASPGGYPCQDNTDCTHSGKQGMCESTGYCSFPDTSCGASHRRYGDLAPSDLAGACVAAAPGGNCVAALSLGAEHSCALKKDKTVWCWGSNEHNQISDDSSLGNQPAPVQIKGLPKDVAELSAGEDHTCVLSGSGQVWCWGSNENGQLGVTTTADPTKPIPNSATPVQVTTLPGPAQAVSAGGGHTCAICDGKAYCWGSNGFAQLGDGTKTDSPVPVEVKGVDNVNAIDCGDEHTCATTKDGRLFCWGTNVDGQCGAGANHPSCATPAQVSEITSATSIMVGDEHTCAERADESIWCWGYNSTGGVGTGTTKDVFNPTRIITGPAVVTGSSSFHTCAIVEHNSNELWCWGANDDGEVGVASTAKAILKPTRVALPTVTEIAATGGKDTCAVTQDGQLWCWGDNELGQLGIGKAGGVYRMPQAVSLCK